MIIKLGSGKSSGGLMRYLEQGKRQVEIGEMREPDLEHRNMAYNSLGATDIKGLERMFRATREVWSKNDGVKVHHASVSMNPGDPVARSMTDEALVELGKNFMERHAPGHDYAIFIHRDREHPHMHLAWNSVNPETGKKFQSTRTKLFDAQRYAREMEGKLGHERVLMPGDPEFKPQRDRLSDAEIHMKVRDQGTYIWKEDLKLRIETARGMADSYPDFVGRLEKMDVAVTERGADRKITYSFNDRDGKQRKTREASLGDEYTRESIEIKIGRSQAVDVIRGPGQGHELADGNVALRTPGPQPGHGASLGRTDPGEAKAHPDIEADNRCPAEIAEVLPGYASSLERAASRIIEREARRFREVDSRGTGWAAANAKSPGGGGERGIEDRGESLRDQLRVREHEAAVPEGNHDTDLALIRARNNRNILMPSAMDEVHDWRKLKEVDRGRENNIRQGSDSERAHDPGISGRSPDHEQGRADRLRGAYQQGVERNVLRAGTSAFAGERRIKELVRKGVKAVGERIHHATGFIVEKFREFSRKIEVPFKVALDREQKHNIEIERQQKHEQELKKQHKIEHKIERGRGGFDLGR